MAARWPCWTKNKSGQRGSYPTLRLLAGTNVGVFALGYSLD